MSCVNVRRLSGHLCPLHVCPYDDIRTLHILKLVTVSQVCKCAISVFHHMGTCAMDTYALDTDSLLHMLLELPWAKHLFLPLCLT